MPDSEVFAILLTFPPKAQCEVTDNGRSSGLPRFERLPISRANSGSLLKALDEAYSSGDCSGLSPDSLLSLAAKGKGTVVMGKGNTYLLLSKCTSVLANLSQRSRCW